MLSDLFMKAQTWHKLWPPISLAPGGYSKNGKIYEREWSIDRGRSHVSWIGATLEILPLSVIKNNRRKSEQQTDIRASFI